LVFVVDFSKINIEEILFPEMTGWLLAAKIFFVLFNLGVIAFIVYVWSSTVYLRRLFLWDLVEFFTFRAYNVKLIEKDWNKIKKRLLTQNPAQMKLAMIEADLLVKDVLFRIGYPGKDLAEQLESPKADVFSNIDAMKEADRLYRQIVRDPKIPLDYQTAKTAILSFEQGLKDARAFRNK